MLVAPIHVRVYPENADAFIAETRENHGASINEPGNHRFDVLQTPDDPTRLVLYEAYVSGHKKTAHYLNWREAVANMMAEPRRGESMNGPFPV